MSRVLCSVLITLVTILAAACSTRALTPTLSPTFEISRECIFEYDAAAWLDANEDGIRDRGEAALSGVIFHISGGWTETTDDSGRVYLRVSWGGTKSCGTLMRELETEQGIGVYPEAPAGYHFTTAPKLLAESGKLLEFGFAPDGSPATVSPEMPAE